MAEYPTEEPMYPTEEPRRPSGGSQTNMPIIVKRRPSEQSGEAAAHPSPAAPAATSYSPFGGQEDYSKNAKELAEVQAELAELDEDESTVDERLQLHSEVIGLRKELEMVQQDEERLRRQRDDTERIVAEHDPEVDKEVAMLEDEAEQSHVRNIWQEESAIHNPEKMDWATIDISNLAARLSASKRTVQEADAQAEKLFAQRESRINANTDSREETKANLRETFTEEMGNLTDARQRVRQVEAEQHYHQHRGTTKGRVPAVNKQKMQNNRERRIDRAEAKTSEQVDAMNTQLEDLMEECKLLKKQLDESRRITGEKQQVLETQLRGVEEEGTEARELREKLAKEKEELVALKSDLQGVLHYVRAKNREDEEF